ncbi:HEPN domain-containing protein [Microcoleus sp. Pol12A5]|uniref:HEPN domain-containing protein n=1 Tax=Microcoleus sp. Pol12A5 TaxID=3055392 RepID=UPI002FD6BAF6
MNSFISSHRQKIDARFNKVSSISDPADQGEWSRYLCILVSGYIEESLRILLETYAVKNASPYIQNFVCKEIKGITNCKTNKIIDILGKFHSDWGTNFISQIAAKSNIDNEIKDSIDSIVTTRHAIAHGKSVGVSYSTVSNYYKNVKKAVEVLENIIS